MIHGLLGPLEDITSPPTEFGAEVHYARLPGYGSIHVQPPSGGITLDGQAQAVIEQLHQSGLQKVWVLGHSVGGAIAMRVASLAPELVEGLLSVEGNFTLNDAFWCRRIAQSDLESWRIEHTNLIAQPESWLVKAGIESTPTSIAQAQRILGYQSAETLHAVAQAVVRDTGDPTFLEDIRHQLNRGLAVHLIAGEKSVSDWDIPTWVRQTSASFNTVPQTGHMLMLEKPQAFWDAIKEALGLV
jgi:pimeloyl-ACP methyl ester carboxylesterase